MKHNQHHKKAFFSILKLRKSKSFKGIALTMGFLFFFDMLRPTAALALTGGPSQPEVQSFEPVGTTQMVDLFTGDFTYNIPLFELPGPSGGYPFNLAYHAGIGMDQEASWVGLGWNLNPGAVNRNMRGLPDDFDGDEIITTNDMKATVKVGANFSNNVEFLGGDDQISSIGLSLYYQSYRGVGYGLNLGSSSKHTGLNWGVSLDSQEGMGANLAFSAADETVNGTVHYNLGLSFGSRSGLNITTGLTQSSRAYAARSATTLSAKPKSGTYGGSTISFSQTASPLSFSNRISK